VKYYCQKTSGNPKQVLLTNCCYVHFDLA